MTRPETSPTDADLVAALRDLGRSLDAAPERAASQRTRVLAAIDQSGGERAAVVSLDRVRAASVRAALPRVVAAAAVLLLAVMALMTPAREAVADWLGIGAVRVSNTDEPPPSTTVVPSSSSAPDSMTADEVDQVARAVPFDLRLPELSVAGPVRSAVVDPDIGGGLIELRYDELTIVQVATRAGELPSLEKLVGPGTTITAVEVGASDGLWLAGEPHAIAHLGPDGEVDVDSVRRAGNVLLWEQQGVTVRIEGAATLDAALAVAASMG